MNASPIADPKAEVSKYIAWTNDFRLAGDFVYAYSNPVTLAKISEIPTRIYAGVCHAI